MARLFTFGCSFTNYMWPTWANIIAFDQQIELKNFAVAGMGNVGIMQRVLEADLKYKFTPDDQIMIMWTSWSREDKVIDNHYQGKGSIFNHNFSYQWLKDNWSMENDIIKNISAIHIVNKLYGDYIVWQGHSSKPYTSEIDGHKEIYTKRITEEYSTALVTKLYQQALPDIEYRILEQDKLAFDCFGDSHPDVVEHMEIVKTWIYPALGLELREETHREYESLQQYIHNIFTKKQITKFEDAIPIVNGILIKQFPQLMEYQDIQSLLDNIEEISG